MWIALDPNFCPLTCWSIPLTDVLQMADWCGVLSAALVLTTHLSSSTETGSFLPPPLQDPRWSVYEPQSPGFTATGLHVSSSLISGNFIVLLFWKSCLLGFIALPLTFLSFFLILILSFSFWELWFGVVIKRILIRKAGKDTWAQLSLSKVEPIRKKNVCWVFKLKRIYVLESEEITGKGWRSILSKIRWEWYDWNIDYILNSSMLIVNEQLLNNLSLSWHWLLVGFYEFWIFCVYWKIDRFSPTTILILF